MMRLTKLLDLIVLTILVFWAVCYIVDPQWDPDNRRPGRSSLRGGDDGEKVSAA
jgi:hypothetical protein